MRYLLRLFCLLMLFSCHQPSKPAYEVSKIELRRSGPWPQIAQMSLDSSLTYNYYGGFDTLMYDQREESLKKYEYYTGKGDTFLWDVLNEKLAGINFETIPNTGSVHVASDIECQLIIHWINKPQKKYRFWLKNSDSTSSVSKFIFWLNNSYQLVNLKRVDSIIFESPFPVPVRPKVPPIKSNPRL